MGFRNNFRQNQFRFVYFSSLSLAELSLGHSLLSLAELSLGHSLCFVPSRYRKNFVFRGENSTRPIFLAALLDFFNLNLSLARMSQIRFRIGGLSNRPNHTSGKRVEHLLLRFAEC